MKCSWLAIGFVLIIHTSWSQDQRWQQRVEYTMNVRLETSSHKLSGTQKLVYYNNSRDTLNKVYYHLYFNAFQPGSMMDLRSQYIADPDKRIADRIAKLTPQETGYQKIQSLSQDDKPLTWRVDGTILEVTLAKPVLPGTRTHLNMSFEAQVPIQIRRSGRNSKEGVAYSMTQWYPKIAAYDHQGWHVNQYVAREFYGVWGDFDVTITLDPNYVVAGTGELENADRVGHGYEKEGTHVKRPKGDLPWHFVARNVHDFAWAADPQYQHQKIKVPDGPWIHFFYQPGEKTQHWQRLPPIAAKAFQFLSSEFGAYPYSTYSVIQGGDGGMEYPMCTLILGEGEFAGTAETMIHEISHTWFQMLLANNESAYAWMDEGFATFAENEILGKLFNLNLHAETYKAYTQFVLSGKEEPSSQYSDFFTLNKAYNIASYIKGSMFLQQLRYIMGETNFWRGMKKYFNEWKFRHPEPNDFIRIMEKTSGLQLKWFLNYWIYTTKQIDYSIQRVIETDGHTFITIERIGELPMPIDLEITYQDGHKEHLHIPLNETLGTKPTDESPLRKNLAPWLWVAPSYTLKIDQPSRNISKLQLDPSGKLADVHPKDNILEMPVPK